MRTRTHLCSAVMRALGGAWALAAGAMLCVAPATDAAPETATSQIYVTSDPPGASVSCDGTAAATPTPTTLSGLAPGEHLLVLRKAGFLETRTTVTTRAGERVPVELRLEPVKGLVLIRSKPEGADIEMDGVHYGKTPRLAPDFPLGPHKIKLSLSGHLPKTVEITVADRTPLQVEETLLSDSARVTIESKPPGADVTLDGGEVGKTPLTVPRLSSGSHPLTVRLKGFAAYADTLTVQAGDDRKLALTLTALPGTLAVASVPAQARIYLNGQYKADAPFATNALPAGKYTIRAELRGYDPVTVTNTVTAGETTSVELRLTKNSGTLLLSTTPAGVTVFLDGEPCGTTAPLEQQPISAQLQMDLVPQGAHKLQLSKEGYFDLTKTVEIVSNQTVILHEKLKPRPVPFVPNVRVRTGAGEENTFRGVVRERYPNGDLKLEIEPGIFRVFRKAEILAAESITNALPATAP